MGMSVWKGEVFLAPAWRHNNNNRCCHSIFQLRCVIYFFTFLTKFYLLQSQEKISNSRFHSLLEESSSLNWRSLLMFDLVSRQSDSLQVSQYALSKSPISINISSRFLEVIGICLTNSLPFHSSVRVHRLSFSSEWVLLHEWSTTHSSTERQRGCYRSFILIFFQILNE